MLGSFLTCLKVKLACDLNCLDAMEVCFKTIFKNNALSQTAYQKIMYLHVKAKI